ncbi:MAG: type II toxin-antitoxin system RelE/ParE family toxin [Eggerthellaceae bacterium]|jgi:proteic killer suppression protein|nr:type II toxin-antitoxin system RelE/ParE family toxin [Eggerthellaceae bacterium]MDR2716113.1 type II toxin-antitoxin system RelE/ParE family toxin [Coriobacteriaceae bacterium]
MIISFADKETETLYRTGKSRKFPPGIIKGAVRKLDRLHTVEEVFQLKNPPRNRLHELVGDKKGRYSISVNSQWRICFRYFEGNAYDVEICDYH